MRNVFSIILNVIAGFFFYTVSLLGFVNGPSANAKWGLMLGFTIPAILALCGGLALRHFRNWKRDTGIVLVSSSGFTAFLVFTFACLLMTDEFRMMMKPGALTLFSDYFSGGVLIVGLAALGLFFLKTSKECVEHVR